MIVIVFRARLRPGVDMAALGALGERIYALATAMPGLVSYKDYAAADGENVTIVEFASEPELLAWRNHPEHREAQQLGRDKLYAAYDVIVCTPLRRYTFPS